MANQDESLVAYCGLYCGDCMIFKGEIADLAKELLDKFKESDFERVAHGLSELSSEFKALSHYQQCYETLCAMDVLRCHQICKQGGGSTSCKIRDCCIKKGIEGCWLCNEFEHCEILAWLRPVNGDANLKNLREIRKCGIQSFISGPKYW